MITTDRLLLREFNSGDLAQLARVLSNTKTMAFWPQPLTIEQVQGWLESSIESYLANGFGRWLILDRQTLEVIGDCGIRVSDVNGVPEHDLGYIIHHPWWRQGFAYEAAYGCMKYGFEQLKLDRLVANMAYDHAGSIAVAEKLGMKKECEFYNSRNRNILTLVYSMSQQEFLST